MDGSGAGDSADTLRPGTQLGRYEIRRLLGKGGMGAVYEAQHRDLKKRVAIKTLLPALASSADARERFLREGEAASRIRHPHVVDVTDVGAEGTIIYLVMEYLEGEDLARLIARQGSLSVMQAADIMLPVAAAIATAHEQGVIHRDLKPENIFLARSGYGGTQPKVLDFGISKVLGDSRARALTGTAATMGTMNYLPPEQLRAAREADARSDQYGLGTILYECVTGQRAFDEDNFYIVLKKIAEGIYAPPSSRQPDLSPRMEAIIMRAMSLEPLDRFESVKHLGAALLELASDAARSIWTPFFSDLPATVEPSGGGTPRARAITDRPRVATLLEPSTPPSGATLELPGPSRRSANTTMRNATGERASYALPQPRRSRVPLMIAGIALLAGGAAVIALRTPGLQGQRSEAENAGIGGPATTSSSPIERTDRAPAATTPGAASAAPNTKIRPTETNAAPEPERVAPTPAQQEVTPATADESRGMTKAERKLARAAARAAATPPGAIGKKPRGTKKVAPTDEPTAPESNVALPNNAPIIP
jgi:serine/threonine protein kinase